MGTILSTSGFQNKARWSTGILGENRISIYICNYINKTENPLPPLFNIQSNTGTTSRFQGLTFTCHTACLSSFGTLETGNLQRSGLGIFPFTCSCLNCFTYLPALTKLILTIGTNSLKYLQRNQNLQINVSTHKQKANFICPIIPSKFLKSDVLKWFHHCSIQLFILFINKTNVSVKICLATLVVSIA